MSCLSVVADRFYPGDPSVLRRTLAELVPDVLPQDKQDALAIISPHAGYVYSGAVAGETVAHVNVPETVLILGPNHHGRGAALALGTETWTMPMGDVSIDRNLAEAILQRSSIITHDETAHAYEHSLEVQVPFLQFFQANLNIVPIVVSHVSYETCVRAANNLTAAIKSADKPVLMVASTDMTHYES
ncbi:MAG: AmmeMemoRadiSam system protein B, partial [Desulfobulbaceae bacterium]|nr:AmmeMemoRadiSam system protein B [Desulfobulbaceae bacterium]